MSKRMTGGVLILAAVLLALVAAGVVIAGGIKTFAFGSVGYVLIASVVALLGLGVGYLSVDGPIFGGRLARRGLKTLAFGLVGDAAIFGLIALPGLEGSKVMVLFIPWFVIGWVTMIGLGMTVVALIAAGGRPRWVGAAFLSAPVAAFLVNAFVARWTGIEGASLNVIADAIVGAGALMVGFVGLAILALDGHGVGAPLPQPPDSSLSG